MRAADPVFVRARRLASLIPELTFPVKNFFLGFVCLFVLIGCAGVKPPAPAPGLALPPIKTIESLQASGVVIVKKGISMSGRATVLVQRPGSFRIEVSGPFGQTAVLLISDGDTFYTYSNGDEQTLHWDDPLMPYPIKAQEFVSLLTGGAADSSATDEADMKGAMIEKTGIDSQPFTEGTVIRIEKTGSDGLPFEVLLSDYRMISGITLPFNIKLTRGIEELTIKYSDVEINPAIPSDAFQVSAGR